MKQTRLLYIDLVKIMAMVLVVVIHLCTPGWKAEGSLPGWGALNLYDAVAHIAVPLFLMASGALMLSPDRPLTPKKALLGCLPRIVVAFAAWSAVYAAVGYFTGALTLTDAAKQLVTGEYHMWYMFVIAMLYAVTPLLQCIAADRRLLRYFLALSLVFTVVLPTVGRYIGAVDTLTGYFYMQLPVGYTFYYCAGYYLHTTDLRPGPRALLYASIGLGAVLTVLAAETSRDAVWFDAFSPWICLTALGVFALVRSLCRGRTSGKWATALGGATLGVYLMHELVLKALAALGWMPTAATAAWSVPLLAVGVSAVCFAVAAAARLWKPLRYFF